MTKENAGDKAAKEGANEIRRHPDDQGGHTGMHGHGGQQSGGMGGAHGGDLHDIGSGQSGMTGGGAMGGNSPSGRQGGPGGPSGGQAADGGAQDEQRADEGARRGAGDANYDEYAEVQQSVPREGMGNHRHSGRGNEQAIDADADVDDFGSHVGAAGHSRNDKAS